MSEEKNMPGTTTDAKTEASVPAKSRIKVVKSASERIKEASKSAGDRIKSSSKVKLSASERIKLSKERKANKATAGSGRGRGSSRRRGGRRDRRAERPKPEFDQKIVSIRRVTRVVAGGRRFSFSVCMVIGDKKGRVGVGLGKASDTALAIDKAIKNAKKNMITVKRTETNSLPADINMKYCASKISIRPAPSKGLAAGGAVRTVLEFAGVTDVSAKIMSRSKNHLNNARATVKALEELNELE